MTEPCISPEWLLSKGFIEATPFNLDEIEGIHDFPIYVETWERLFIEIEFSRNQFAVLLARNEYTNGQEWYSYEIYVKDDVGCGCVQIPLRSSEMTIKQFEMLYEAITTNKLPDATIKIRESTNNEIRPGISLPIGPLL